MKTVLHGAGDHEIRLGADGVWRIHVVGDSFSLFESTDCEICMEAIDEVEEELYLDLDDSSWKP